MSRSQRFFLALSVTLLASTWSVAAQPSDVLRVGIIKYKTEKDVLSTFTPLFEYVAGELGRSLDLRIVPEEDLGFELSRDRYDLGLFTPFLYLEARLDFPQLEVFASHVVSGEDHYRGAILTRPKANVRTLAGLRGQRFLFVKPTSTSGYKYPSGIFREHNIDVHSDFSHTDFSGSHAGSIEKLLTGETDGIAVDTAALAAYLAAGGDQLLALETYKIPLHAYVFSSSLEDSEREEIQRIMFEAHRDPAARAAFHNGLRIERWHPKDDTYYNQLRRYLRIVRVKPALKITLEAKEGARKTLAAKGDVLSNLESDLIEELRETHRFSAITQEPRGRFHNAQLTLFQIEDQFRCQIYVDGNRVRAFHLPEKELLNQLARFAAESILEGLPIETRLLRNETDWFVTFGKNDGLTRSDYEIRVSVAEGEKITLREEDIQELTDLNTYLRASSKFEAGQKVQIGYQPSADFNIIADPLEEAEEIEQGGFWSQLDNVWGVVGLLVAFLTIAAGGYLSRRKHRRFQKMMYELNTLLKEFVEGQYRLDSKLLEQKEKINRSLEDGSINGNQCLILKDRLKEIHQVVQQISAKGPPPSSVSHESVKAEIRGIAKDGVITEKEYSQLIRIIHRHQDSAELEEKPDREVPN